MFEILICGGSDSKTGKVVNKVKQFDANYLKKKVPTLVEVPF